MKMISVLPYYSELTFGVVLLTGLVIGQKQFEKFMGLCIVFNAVCSVHVNNNMK